MSRRLAKSERVARRPATTFCAGGAIIIAATLTGAPAATADGARMHSPPAEQRVIPYSGALPDCGDPSALAEIATGFTGREHEFWSSGLAISNFERVWEAGYRTNGPSYIPRRYCSAEALFNDGARRRVVYSIGESLGFISLGEGVTWCVVGLDRNHAFSPNCRAAGP